MISTSFSLLILSVCSKNLLIRLTPNKLISARVSVSVSVSETVSDNFKENHINPKVIHKDSL